MLTVKDLMTANPDTITPDATLGAAIAEMNRFDDRQLPVVDKYGRLVGMITERDIRLAVNSPLLSEDSTLRIRLLERFLVEDCMTRHVVSVLPETPLHEAAKILATRRFGALPVVMDNELVGILSVTDLLEYLARQPALEANMPI
ncbi:MAG: CBS domain-containing protein [Anaerolineales bacterium]|nr:CBS domain-containing protein [Anaerolineales bacterium]MCB9432713.1 CBS domain-containing protein [Ardenticatenaceae bacterium]